MWQFIQNTVNTLGSFALEKLLPAVIIVALGILAVQIALKVISVALERAKLEKAAHTLIRSVVRVVLYLLVALMAASSLGIDVTGIVALTSVLTLAVSLSLQNALSNVIGGFTLLYTKPFASGDFVEIAGQSGSVQEIGLTYTKLATADNKLVSIPNSAVVAAQIVNFTVTGTRRVDVTVSASYDMPAQQVLDALMKAAQVPTALSDPAVFAGVKNYGESAMEYVLQVWTTAEDYWSTLFTVNQRIQSIFEEEKIQMTYPHLNVHLKQ